MMMENDSADEVKVIHRRRHVVVKKGRSEQENVSKKSKGAHFSQQSCSEVEGENDFLEDDHLPESKSPVQTEAAIRVRKLNQYVNEHHLHLNPCTLPTPSTPRKPSPYSALPKLRLINPLKRLITTYTAEMSSTSSLSFASSPPTSSKQQHQLLHRRRLQRRLSLIVLDD